MRGILLWLIGIPIPIIILLWLFGVLHIGSCKLICVIYFG